MRAFRTSRRLTNIGAPLAAAVLAGWTAARYFSPPRLRNFRNQVVVIIGGARGLGLELARIWSREGARVAICARSGRDVDTALAELRESGANVFGKVCDVTDARDVEEFIAAVVDEFGTVDVLVNNAGVIQVGPSQCMTVEDYRHAMATHFWGPLYTIQAVLPEMRRRRSGALSTSPQLAAKSACLTCCRTAPASSRWSDFPRDCITNCPAPELR